MRTESAIRHKLKQVKFRYLKKYLAEYYRQSPEDCMYNLLMPPAGDDYIPSVCGWGRNGPGWEPSYCDRTLDDGQRARECTFFCRSSERTKAQIKADFDQHLRGLSIAMVASNYPDMAALLWVLGVDVVPEDVFEDDAEIEDPSPPAIVIVAPPNTEDVSSPPYVEDVPSPPEIPSLEEGKEEAPVEVTKKKDPWYKGLLNI